MMNQIPGHEGYFVDTDGNVYSQWINKGRHGLQKGTDIRKLKGSANKKGHRFIRFTRNSNPIYIHRLIYETFKGPIPEGLVIRHLNDIPYDNRLENLEVGTVKENVMDSIKLGNFPRGQKNGQSKLTDEEVLMIKTLSTSYNKSELGRKFNVNRKTISAILEGRTWKHIKNNEVI
jgi:hypothetical protein